MASIADRIADPVGGPLPAPSERRSTGYWTGVAKRALRDPVAIGAAGILVLIIALALLAPYLGLQDPYRSSMIRRLKPIGTPGYILGTDELGRDMLTRLIYGGRLSLFMGVTPVVIAFIIGSGIGIGAGYVGGRINTVVMRTIDVFFACDDGAPRGRVLAESVTTAIRSVDYVEAARASGASAWTIIRVHVLGNVLGPIFVFATSLISVSMILASGLSFLGLGVKPPEPEWGLMLNTLRSAIYVQPWVAALPGAMIFITSISFNLLSDGLRTAMDIKA